MNDLLQQVWFDNTVRNYLLVAATILFVIIMKRLISRYLASLMFRVVNRIWTGMDKRSFISLLLQPLSFFLLVLISILALHKLNFPTRFNVEIYGYSLKHIMHSCGTIILIISFIWLLLRIIDFISMILEIRANLTPDQSDNQLVIFFRDFFKVIVSLIGAIMILNFVFDVNVGSLITGLSIIGAAIALALRESLENLIASFIIFFDKPFTTGDLVKVQQVTGTVEKIGLRSTRIRSEGKTLVSVPNKQMVDSILDNLSLRTQRKGEMKLELSLLTPTVKLESFLVKARAFLTRDDIEESGVYMNDITGQSLLVIAEYFTAPVTIAEFNDLKQELNIGLLRLLEEMQINISGANNLRMAGLVR